MFDGIGTRLAGRQTPRPPALRRHHYLPVVGFAVAAGVLIPALVDSNSDRNLVNLWLIYSVAATGFYWTFGLAGRFAFSQTLSMALGGYLTAWAAREGWPFWSGLGLALVGAGLVAAVAGWMLRRSTDFAFAIGTVAMLEIGHVVLARTSEFTGRHGDVTGVPYPTWFGNELTTEGQVFWLFLGVLTAVLLLSVMIERSPLRRTLAAGRENSDVARALGRRVIGTQVLFFAMGSALGGLSGALTAHWQGVTGVNSFGIDLAVGLFLIVILGGRHSLWGGVIGAGFYIWIPELLTGFERYREIAYSLLLLTAIMAFPDGLVGLFHRCRQMWRRPARGRVRRSTTEAPA